MMKNDKQGSNVVNVVVFLASSFFIFGGVFAVALSYDYTSIIDCLAEPHKPQYNGGILVNPEINDGLNGWIVHEKVKIEPRVSLNGNNFIVAQSRRTPLGSVSQKVFLEKGRLYTFSAWIQISGRKNAPIVAIFNTTEGLKPAGSVVAQVGCWSMLKGGITIDTSTPAEFYFQSNDISIDIWIDSVSLQPFTQEEWKSHQDESIEKVRKSNVRAQVLTTKGKPLSYTNISLEQNKAKFPIGASINYNIVSNGAYQKWFMSRFKVTTFENEMKWYSTEDTRGKEDYSKADAMLRFTSKHGISVRGHNIFWDDPSYQPRWVQNLSPNALKIATDKRLNSVVSRYAGKVIAWDVNNENLHFNFFESKLGEKITDVFFQRTQQIDKRTTLFMNDYNTIEDERDTSSSPSMYLQKLKELQGFLGTSTSLGIGLEGHFSTPNIPYIRSTLDSFASTNLPVWITELDVKSGPNQVSYFEQILREVHSHPAIKGIVIWGPWSPPSEDCYNMCLVNPHFQNLPAGDVLDKLLAEWGHKGQSIIATTDEHGFFNTSLFHGDYHVNLLHQHQNQQLNHTSYDHDDDDDNYSPYISQSLKVDAHSLDHQTFKIIAQDSL